MLKGCSSTAEIHRSPEGLLLSLRDIFTFVDGSAIEYVQPCCTEIFRLKQHILAPALREATGNPGRPSKTSSVVLEKETQLY